MKLFDLLGVLDPDVSPERCKIHLAMWNGIHEPLDIYLKGEFDEWQTGQTARNFERDHVLALIQLPGRETWLFAGLHDAGDSVVVISERTGRRLFRYQMARRPQTNELDGRLVVHFQRPGRQSYLRAERWLADLTVAAIRPERLVIADFPGYSSCRLSKAHLDIIVGQGIESWRAALENVAGVYVIADTATGKLYIGSASGEGGIWSRWCAYSKTGHGGNKELRALLKAEGAAYASNFQYGILEIAGTQADDVLQRESYWKDVLLTRQPHGLNAN